MFVVRQGVRPRIPRALKKTILRQKYLLFFGLIFYQLTFIFFSLYCLSNCFVSIRGDVSVQQL